MKTGVLTRSILTHGTWVAVAGATYYLGTVAGGDDAEKAAAADPTSRVALVAPSAPVVVAAGGSGDADAPGGAVAGESRFSQTFTKSQIRDLATDAFREPSQLKRSLAFSKLLESLTPENAIEIMDAMRELGAGRDEWQLFTYAWGAKDGEGALAHAATLEGRRKDYATRQSLTGWASADPTAALDWLAKQGDVEGLSRLRESLIGGLADHDIAMATAQVYKFADEGDERAAQYLEDVAEEKLRTSGHLEAASWATELRDGPIKGAALDRVAGRYVNEDPEAAAAWAAQFASADYGVRVIEEVSDEWAERDPVAAVAWLESIPEGAARIEGMESAFDEWVDRDPRAASEYLAGMPASPMKDAAVNGFAEELSERDPVSAVVWAETIGQEDLRVRTLTRVARNWYRRDAPTALEWLDSTNLPPEAVQEIIEPRRGRRGR